MTPKEAAEILAIEYTTVLYHLKKTGRLTGHKDDLDHWQVDPESVTAFQGAPRSSRGAGRKPSPATVRDAGRRSLFLGTDISPEQVVRIRRLIPARIRAAVLLRLASYAEREGRQGDHKSLALSLSAVNLDPGINRFAVLRGNSAQSDQHLGLSEYVFIEHSSALGHQCHP